MKGKAGTITPVAGYVLIDPVSQEKMTSSGIVLPDTVSGDKPQQGKVVAVGGPMLHESGKEVSCPCKVGDSVIYKKWGGNEYKAPGSDKEQMFVKFDDIMAVITG